MGYMMMDSMGRRGGDPGAGAPTASGQEPCVKCGVMISAGARFCPNCGAAQSAACPGCGADIDPDAKFCPKCGAKLGGTPIKCPGGGKDVQPAVKFCPECGHNMD